MLPRRLRLSLSDNSAAAMRPFLSSDGLLGRHLVPDSVDIQQDRIDLVAATEDDAFYLLREIESLQYQGLLSHPIEVTFPEDVHRAPILLDCPVDEVLSRECELATRSLTRNVGLFAEQLLRG